MKLSKFSKLFLAIAIGLLLREVIWHDFNYLKTNVHPQFKPKWTSQTFSIDTFSVSDETAFRKIASFPIAVLYGRDTICRSEGDGPLCVLKIKDIQTGPLWMPFYKNISYEAKVSCSFNSGLFKTAGHKLLSVNISGSHVASGEITIMGLCSSRNSLKLIKDLVAEDARKAANRYIASLIGNSPSIKKNQAILASESQESTVKPYAIRDAKL